MLYQMWAGWIIPLNHGDCHIALKNKTQIYVVNMEHFFKMEKKRWKSRDEQRDVKQMQTKRKQGWQY